MIKGGGIKKYFYRKLRKPEVYALVGKAGTGKSFRSRLIMEKHSIELMIDDGLLIRGHRILAGRSAKRESTKIAAVKRAVFQDDKQAETVRQVLEREKFRRILILGTSEHMVGIITERLALPYPSRVIYIQDVATQDEIARAQESRRISGKHVIPLPVVEVRQHYSHRILETVRFIFSSPFRFGKGKVVEKTVVQPPLSRLGRISITDTALSQMIMHCLAERTPEAVIKKIKIDPSPQGYKVEVEVEFPQHTELGETLFDLQRYTASHIEQYSGINMDQLHLTVTGISGGKSVKSTQTGTKNENGNR